MWHIFWIDKDFRNIYRWNQTIDLSIGILYWQDSYNYFWIHSFLCFLLLTLLLVITVIVSIKSKAVNFEKVSSFDCGFESYGTARQCFNVQFFILGILFMLFEVEFSIVLPWMLSLAELSFTGFIVLFFFVWFFIIGLVYESRRGALEWN